MVQKKPTLLVILDGFGYRRETEGNAIFHAKTPHLDHWFATYPHTLLTASGSEIGLLPNMIGTSEVGHLIMGAGRIIPQPVTIIHDAIDDKTFFSHPILQEKLHSLPKKNRLHLMGLLSDAGVHSHEKHLYAFLKAAAQVNIKNIIVHPFLDGRDTPPQSAKNYLTNLSKMLEKNWGAIGSIAGRFYAMDRDNNWDRTEKCYRVLTQPQTIQFQDWQSALNHYYNQGITDEFIPPTQLCHDSIVQDGDGIIFFNFRPDRARQLTQAFLDPQFDHFSRKIIKLRFFITPTNYGASLPTKILFDQKIPKNTLKEVISDADKTIFSIAETEKYAPVTYFFSGGREGAWPTEEQVLIPSIPAKNYIKHPEMSACKITDAILASLHDNPKDFYLINYANADMVGHSGDFLATVKAIECLDYELKRLYDVVIKQLDGTLYITADHGNAEEMFDVATGQPRTAHTSNPVPFLIIRQGLEHKEYHLPLKTIADIAPFILEHLHLKLPTEMNKLNTRC